ncbi:MAG: hypothetical protein AB1476_02120 [Candidatus Hadarchaeota archaeon]
MNVRMYSALAVMVVGIFALLEGSRFNYGMPLDIVLIAVGAALTLSYIFLIGDSLDKKLGNKDASLLTVLIVVGTVLLYQAGTRPMPIEQKGIFGALGAALVIATARMLFSGHRKKR